jgi:outer membrane protein assembly factor BamA
MRADIQRAAIALAVLFLASALFAQSTTLQGELVVSNLTLSGVSHLAPSEQQSIINEVQSRFCWLNKAEEIKEHLLYAFQERGYFKAKVGSLDIVRRNPGPDFDTVAVSASVDEGQQYRLKEINFSGAKAFPNDQLRSQFQIANGDIFNTEKIRVGLDDLRKLYASQGFINFTPVPNTDADDATRTISLHIDVDEGRQFRVGRLLLDGEEPQAGDGAKLLEAWKPMEGKIYDGRKIEEWWQLAATMLPAGARLEQWLELRQDAASGIVAALLRFADAK